MTAGDDREVRTRTLLAWRRTALTAAGTAVLFSSHAITSGWQPAATAPAAASGMLIALAVIGLRRARLLRRGMRTDPHPAVAATTVVISATCAVGLMIGLQLPTP